VSGPSFRVVVVGIDGSRESEAALRFAADEAKLRGALLRIVCASEPSAAGYLGEAFAPTAGAELLVVGSRGLGAATRLMLGSVSHDRRHRCVPGGVGERLDRACG
jgi:nucleotide-binding universal stress UspA family protein